MAASSVASMNTAGGIQLLAPNSSRDGATIENTDANTLYVLLDSGTPSSTNYTVSMSSGDYYELPAGYRGEVKGIWSADGSGAALILEY